MTRPLFPDDEITRMGGLGRRTGNLERRPAPPAGGAESSYGYCTVEDVDFSSTSMDFTAYDSGWAYGADISLDVDNRLQIDGPGVYVAIACVRYRAFVTEHRNASVYLGSPPSSGGGTLIPWQDGVWGAQYWGAGALSGFTYQDFFPTQFFAVAATTGYPRPIIVTTNKIGTTQRFVSCGLWVQRLGPHAT